MVALAGLLEPLGAADLRDGDVPPVAAGAGAGDGLGVDDDDRGDVAAAGGDDPRLEVGDVGRLLGVGAHRGGVGDEVDLGLRLDVASPCTCC